MNKTSYTYRFIALMLVLLMFFTSVGFVVDLHYCQGQLKTFSFLGEAESCHDMGEGMKNCPSHKKMMEAEQSGATINKKDCCSNKTLHFQSDQNQQVQAFDFAVTQQFQQFVMAYVAVFFTNDFRIGKEVASFVHYEPPVIPRDIYVLLENYRL